MDPVTLILRALAAGALAGTQATASEVISDAYRSLKGLIQRKFAGKSDAELALSNFEEKPEVWEMPLKDTLIQTAVDKDDGVIEAAQRLLTLINPQQAAMGKFNLQIDGDVQGFVQGDNANVTMTFGDDSSEKKSV